MKTEEPANLIDSDGSPIRVLVVDDHPIFRFGVCERIKAMGGRVILVGEASDGIEAQSSTAALRPNVILLDLNMPGISGIETTRNIKADFPETHIIILSSDDKMEDIKLALKAGASGYLLKSVAAPELQEAIFKVVQGIPILSLAVTRDMLTALSQPPVTASVLSRREIEILKMASIGASDKDIAKALSISKRDVESDIRTISQKLGTSSRTEAITQAIRNKIIKSPKNY
ncbi:MAG: response regulator transcription factor [Candidatus Planktophila sp.]|nr:response regulator transcription factor [Candidatus Planktophila sp.]